MSKDPEGWAFDFGCILHDNFNSDAVARIVVPFSAHGFRFAGTARPKTGFGMELLERLLFGSDSLWGGGVAHSVMILALVIALGIMLGKVKVAGVSLGVTGILFVGIAFSYFGMNIDEHLMHFLKEFGLILFVYSIGLQVGPGFFSSFRKGGVTLNKLAVLVVALGVATTVALYYITGLSMTTMVGVMSGAVTNTPGLGAAQQAFSDLHAGADAPDIATGYALAYPLGVIGAILTLLALRYLLHIDVRQEEEAAGLGTDVLKDLTTRRISVEICNPAVEGKSISGIRRLALRDFVVSRICRPGEAPELADAATTLRCGDRILLVAAPKDAGHWSVWKYCIRRAWLADTGVRFWDDVRWAEDWPFDLMLLNHCTRLYFLDTVFTHYRVGRQGSLLTDAKNRTLWMGNSLQINEKLIEQSTR